MDLHVKFAYNFYLLEIVNQTKHYVIRIIHQDEEDFILGIQGLFSI